ncbi:hypothetical protein FNV43_RR11850 [Rhamnella rubrinervis]|uniref:EF-hand domain-containing protein n=1 Tax=Rhamnella rubrinervis TaxID=2594499 RepID=A0A8K0H743_9ROSA|nr:hypothetical protein FNV43_RR11850 [Rhamnella rubrinervis]
MVRDVRLSWNRDLLLNLFKSYDRDGDGKLSRDELKQAFRYLGSRWSSYRAARAFRKADCNKDGYINHEELCELVDYVVDCGYKVDTKLLHA